MSPLWQFDSVPPGSSWDFSEVHGLKFRGKGNHGYTYTARENYFPEEYDFLSVFQIVTICPVPMILTPYLMEKLIGNLNSVRENGI